VANIVAKNKNLILADIKASPVIAKEITKQAAGGAYSKAYDAAQKDTPRDKVKREGMDWNLVKTEFGSSGTEQDNTLLNQAWTKGWRPGQVVPQEFQTKTYKTSHPTV
jgi:Ni/Co efflux regulator RcnB